MDEVRIVLLGKQGAGKSASGNTLLGDQLFNSEAHTGRVTQTCSVHTSTVDKQSIMVVDTPGWPDSSFETEIKEEILKCIDMCSPGPHVFLLVLPIGRSTGEEINTVKDILKEFGDEAFKQMILLFTKGDDLKEKPIEDYLKDIHQDLKNILEKCLGGYHVFNNSDKSSQNQVSSLLQKINHMVDTNDKSCYTKIMYPNVKDQQKEDNCSTKVENLAPNKYFAECRKLEPKGENNSEPNENESEKKEEESKMMLRSINKKTSVEELEQRIIRIEQQLPELKKYNQDKQNEYLEGQLGETDEKESEMMLCLKNIKTSAKELEQRIIRIEQQLPKLKKYNQDKQNEYLEGQLGEIDEKESEMMLCLKNIKTYAKELEQRIIIIEQHLPELKKYKQDKQRENLEGHLGETDEKESEMMLNGEDEKISARDFKQLVFKIDNLKLESEKNHQDTNTKLYELEKHLGEIKNVLSEIRGKVKTEDEEDEKQHIKKRCVCYPI